MLWFNIQERIYHLTVSPLINPSTNVENSSHLFINKKKIKLLLINNDNSV